MTSFTITGTIPNRKLEFTPSERLSIVVAALMQEFTPNNPEEIQDFWDLYAYLNREKQQLLQQLLTSDELDRPVLWKQLDEVKYDLNSLEFYLEIHIKQDKP